jgi:hypothetical protein
MADHLLDVIDTIADGRHFVEAVFLASHAACPEDAHRNAIATTCDAADKKLKQAAEMLDQYRASSACRTRSEATKPRIIPNADTTTPQARLGLPPDFHERLSDIRTRISTIELALGCIDEECSHGQIGDVRRQVLLADTELGKLLWELDEGDEGDRKDAADV